MQFGVGTGLAVAAGIAAVGYCVYFDSWRRSQPDYKEKVKERRLRERSAKKTTAGPGGMPEFADAEAAHRYFLEEMQRSEPLLASGRFDEAVKHIANAVRICDQPTRLVMVLQQSLPAPVFQMLLAELDPESFGPGAAGPGAAPPADEQD